MLKTDVSSIKNFQSSGKKLKPDQMAVRSGAPKQSTRFTLLFCVSVVLAKFLEIKKKIRNSRTSSFGILMIYDLLGPFIFIIVNTKKSPAILHKQ